MDGEGRNHSRKLLGLDRYRKGLNFGKVVRVARVLLGLKGWTVLDRGRLEGWVVPCQWESKTMYSVEYERVVQTEEGGKS